MPDNDRRRDVDMDPTPQVVRLGDADRLAVRRLLARFGLELVEVAEGEAIPGSYWGGEEAGLIGRRLFARDDTPIHSILHEASHFVCMDPQRRRRLDTDAGGNFAEENAVCYLQILLADSLPGIGSDRIMSDMDRWGYQFRLGSAKSWFERDADEALGWLTERDLVDRHRRPRWSLRGHDRP